MSRSYKKHWGFCDKTKGMKRLANKKVRHTPDIPNGMAYKKLFSSYDICDFKSLAFRYGGNTTINKEYEDWYKWRMK